MSTRPTPQRRAAFPAARDKPTAVEHPLDPGRKQERSPLASSRLIAFGTRLPSDLAKEVKLVALQRDVTVQEAVEAALRAWLAS